MDPIPKSMEAAPAENKQMKPIPNLMEAARVGKINGVYEAIKNNPSLLKEIDEIQFVNTPLHEAASVGQTKFATAMIDLAPSFARKLNPDCLSPLHLAVINNHYETVKRLVNFDGELVRVKGKDGLTPLHLAAESDDKIRCLIELLLACPASIEDLTICDESALDIARKSSFGAEAFKILFEWVSRAGAHKQLLQKKDAKGNSAETYHKKQQEVVNKSLEVVKVEKSSLPNADDDTQNMFEYLRTPERFYERLIRKMIAYMLWSQRGLTMEMRNVVLVVAVLIATGTFQAILGPPGGEQGGLVIHINNSSSQGENNSIVFTFSNETTYDFKEGTTHDFTESTWEKFFLLNTTAFAASVGVIIIVLQLRAYTSILHLSLIFMMACYLFLLNHRIHMPFGKYLYIIGSSVYLVWAYYFKILFWTIKRRKPELLAILLFSPCLKKNFRCLQQMGALTMK